MNALVRKEIRLILPAWALAMVLAILPVWLLWPGVYDGYNGYNLQAPGVLVYAPFALGVLLLGLAPFGHELNYGTFSVLLAQPISRRRLWLTKTAIVGAALCIAFVALCISSGIRAMRLLGGLEVSNWQYGLSHFGTRTLILRLITELYREVWFGSLVYGGLSALAAFAGGLWTNLLFRNTSAAFWFTMLIPMGIWMLAQAVFGSVGVFADAALVSALVIYSAAGFLWAKRYFLRVQDTQWTGGVISFPTWSFSRSTSARGAYARKRKPFRALLWKEIQFQQANLFIASLLLLTHLANIAVRKLGAGYFLQHRQAAMIWESWPLLWLAMPLLIGGVAVAEERKLGTMETLLCLPTKRRREFLVKFGIAVVLGAFLGGVMPVLVEWIGSLVGVRSGAGTLALNWTMVSQASALLAGSAALVVLAFYASTLTRNLLEAIGMSVVLSVAAFLLTGLVMVIGKADYAGVALWRGELPKLTILPVMIAAIVGLSFANFKRLQTGSRVWLRNVVVLVVALLCSAAMTTATYHRVWEVWMPVEPVHNFRTISPIIRTPFDLTNQFVKLKMESSLARIAVVLPDGRLWLKRGQVKQIEYKDSGGNAHQRSQEAGPWHSGFAAGTNWLDVAVTPQQCFAIQKDGSLWDLSEVVPGNRDSDAPIRIGNDSDWKSITAGANRFTALKTGGTLWQWGNLLKADGTNISTETVSAPRRLGNDNGWIAIADSRRSAGGVALREDGSVWRYGFVEYTKYGHRFVEEPEHWLSGPSEKPRSLRYDGASVFLTSQDGSLWVGGIVNVRPGLLDSVETMVRASREMVRLGNDWTDVQSSRWGTIGIRRGRLMWLSNRIGRSHDYSVSWEVVSQYDDWIAVCPSDHEFLALAWDGSLCRWNPRALDGPNDPFRWGENQLLMPTRIKAREIADLKR